MKQTSLHYWNAVYTVMKSRQKHCLGLPGVASKPPLTHVRRDVLPQVNCEYQIVHLTIFLLPFILI